jgi:hypothetical protein
MRYLMMLLLSLTMLVGMGQDTTFLYTIGSPADEYALKVKPIQDDFLILANSGDSVFEANSNAVVLRVDINGNVLNSIMVGSAGTDVALDFEVLSNGSFIVVGFANQSSAEYKSFIIGFDSNGNKLFENYSNEVDLFKLEHVFNWDQKVYISGSSFYENSNISLIQINSSNGEVIDQISLDSTSDYEIASIYQTRDTGLLIAGSKMISNDSTDAFLMKLNKLGEVLWETNFSSSANDAFLDVAELSDSNIIAVGYTAGFGEFGDEDILLYKVDQFGDSLKQDVRGYNISGNNKSDRANCVAVNGGDSILVSGYSETYSYGMKDLFLSMNNFNVGDLPGSTTAGTLENDFAIDILPYRKGMVGVGTIENQTLGGSDVLFFVRKRFSNFGGTKIVLVEKELTYDALVLGQNEIESNKGALISRTENKLVVSGVQFPNQSSWQIFDLQGKLVSNQFGSNCQLPNQAGLYIVKMNNDEYSKTVKSIVY